jgi:hypothetical protein
MVAYSKHYLRSRSLPPSLPPAPPPSRPTLALSCSTISCCCSTRRRSFPPSVSPPPRGRAAWSFPGCGGGCVVDDYDCKQVSSPCSSPLLFPSLFASLPSSFTGCKASPPPSEGKEEEAGREEDAAVLLLSMLLACPLRAGVRAGAAWSRR